MKIPEIEWEMRLFKLFSITLILFALLVLKVALGLGEQGSIFMQAEVPSMCLSLVCALIILTVEFSLWYIFRIKRVKISELKGIIS